MSANNGWPGKPWVPMNPERDGWHWLKTPDNEIMPFEWRVAGECERGHWPSYWVSQGEDCWTAEECEYIGPCLTPDEVQNLRDDLASAERERAHQHGRADCSAAEHAREQAKREALQKRVAELEAALKDAAASVKEWGAYASQYLQDKGDLSGEVARYIEIAEGKNDAALMGGKDE